ncbi:hypothetical protein MSAN_00198900 [Mycena sanguinolenta]|uniref:HPr domain-containing protein n=1 Tax=Mycena sanguinolenta TaxID=230812 RepID=A0A8H6ZHR0_9AGAR|nr:hypothetical protein MSAN_00198900 [Mycena sanguinolenta]
MAESGEDLSRSISKLSLHSESSAEDWDRSLSMDSEDGDSGAPRTTPRNSVMFPAGAGDEATPGAKANGKGKRSLSELLRLHAEKGTDVTFSAEEAARVADVLRDWINAGSSPYEDDDDFFTRGSQDDLALPGKTKVQEGRARGRSDVSAGNSRPPSAAGSIKSKS